MRMRAIVAVLICLAAAAAASGQDSSQTNADRRRAIASALGKPDGLHKAATLSDGNYIGLDDNPGFIVYQDLGHIASQSSHVVVGTVVSNACQLRTYGEHIVTRYEVRITEALKGDESVGKLITVDLPGGRYTFTDATTAEIRTPHFLKMFDGHTYLLYLSKVTDVDEHVDRYMPTGGAQGVFELAADEKTVIPHTSHGTHPFREKGKQNQKEFLAEARATAHQPLQ